MWLFDRYKKIKILGQGATSEVILVFDQVEKQYVCIKQLHKCNKKLSYQRIQTMFTSEVRSLSILSHPHICKLKATFEDQESFYIVMTYIQGMPLSHFPTIVEEIAIRFMYQTIAIVSYVHACHIYHLDVKPQNILLKNDQVYLIDFGTSKQRGDTNKTNCATLAYACDEVLHGNAIDRSCDVYSFGVLFYVLLFQRLPDDKGYVSDMQRFLLTCCQKEKEHRYKTFLEVKKGLDTLLHKRIIK